MLCFLCLHVRQKQRANLKWPSKRWWKVVWGSIWKKWCCWSKSLLWMIVLMWRYVRCCFLALFGICMSFSSHVTSCNIISLYEMFGMKMKITKPFHGVLHQFGMPPGRPIVISWTIICELNWYPSWSRLSFWLQLFSNRPLKKKGKLVHPRPPPHCLLINHTLLINL